MISAKGLTKSFNKHKVLDNVNIDISKGERVVFIGRNGSGKTTFIRCLLGLYKFDGVLNIDGINPRSNRVEILKHVGYVPQTSPPINMRVNDLMKYAADISDKPYHLILETSKTLGLDLNNDIHQNFLNLSGGMKQKVLIAVAMGRGNDIIIMDEPTSNLDPNSRKIFYDLISACAEGMTVILTSHRADELKFFASRIIEMDYGRIIRDEVVR